MFNILIQSDSFFREHMVTMKTIPGKEMATKDKARLHSNRIGAVLTLTKEEKAPAHISQVLTCISLLCDSLPEHNPITSK